MKKFLLLTIGMVLFSCSIEDSSKDQSLIEEIASLSNNVEEAGDKNSSNANKDEDNDGINDLADADVDGDGIIDNGNDSDGDGINDLADADNDNDGIDDNGTDIDHDGINDEYDDDIDGDGIANENDEYQNLSDTHLDKATQEKITAFINANYSGNTITEVEIENQRIEVEVSENIELYFDLNGNFLSVLIDNSTHGDTNSYENEYNTLSSSPLSALTQEKITAYINTNYPNLTIFRVEIENQRVEVEISGNIELYFDFNGNFLTVEIDNSTHGDNNSYENEYNPLSSSPLSISIQEKIIAYINTNYPNFSIVEIEIENQKIEVELSNDIELIFDMNGNFLWLDY